MQGMRTHKMATSSASDESVHDVYPKNFHKLDIDLTNMRELVERRDIPVFDNSKKSEDLV